MVSEQAGANLNFWLSQITWNFSHPKIQDWVRAVSIRQRKQINNFNDLTEHQCNRLARFLELICDCDRILQNLKTSWQDAEVRAVFSKYGNSNKMTIEGWEELHTILDARYKEFMPF